MDWEEFREQEENEYFLEFLKRSQETYFETSFNEAVALLGDLSMPIVPDPNTEHPGLAKDARFVRNLNKPHAVLMKVAIPRTIKDYCANDYDPKEDSTVFSGKFIMTRKWCSGPVPFVGDPIWEDARYFWPVWYDDLGRFIAGDSKLEWYQCHWDLRRKDKPTRDYPS